MDWANERYVRIYTRETADDLVLSWQANGLWPQLVRKADRSGVIATNHGARGIAALVRWPVDVVTDALAELVEDGRVQECSEPRGYVIPNYLAAQETPSSDRQRQREQRERRGKDANSSVTKRDGGVTKRDANVTGRHGPSRGVTPYLAVPNQAIEDLSGKPDAASELAEVAVREINRIARKNYRADSETVTRLCKALARAKRTAAQVVAVIESKRPWISDPKMAQYFAPGTLLAASNFAKYLDEIDANHKPTRAVDTTASTPRDDDEPDLTYSLWAVNP